MDDEADETELFREAVKGARPLKVDRLTFRPAPPPPIPRQFIRDEQQALADSLSDDYLPPEEQENGEELLYVRGGHAPDLLRKLRRGHWVVQAALDLHGMQVDEARASTADFLNNCKKRGWRCVRIIHGKGTGKLRQAVREALKGHAYVKSFEEGGHTEGGEGVTVAKMNAG